VTKLKIWKNNENFKSMIEMIVKIRESSSLKITPFQTDYLFNLIRNANENKINNFPFCTRKMGKNFSKGFR
jgi:hypothetical protein